MCIRKYFAFGRILGWHLPYLQEDERFECWFNELVKSLRFDTRLNGGYPNFVKKFIP